MRRILQIVVVVLLGSTPRTLGAQGAATPSSAALRAPFALTLGLQAYSSADDDCGAGPGPVLGFEARTRGSWLVAGDADVVFPGLPALCLPVFRSTEWRGRQVEVRGAGPFGYAYRVSARAGRAFRLGSRTVTAGVTAGLIRPLAMAPYSGRGPEPFWYGAFVRSSKSRVGWDVEVTSLGFTAWYVDWESGSPEVVHELVRRRPMIRLALVVPVGGDSSGVGSDGPTGGSQGASPEARGAGPSFWSRLRVTPRAGLTSLAEGFGAGCSLLYPSLGVEVRTGSPFFLLGAADYFGEGARTGASDEVLCSQPPEYDGDTLDYRTSGLELAGAGPARLVVGAGAEHGGSVVLELWAGAGVTWAESLDGAFHPWVGGSLGVRLFGDRVLVALEKGWNRIPVHHELHSWPAPRTEANQPKRGDEPFMVRESHVWAGIGGFRVGVRFPIEG